MRFAFGCLLVCFSWLPLFPGPVGSDAGTAAHSSFLGAGKSDKTLNTKPSWLQQHWISAESAAAFAIAGIIMFACEQRSRLHARHAFELKRAKEMERLRISRDLHDHLGATLTEVAMLAENGADGMNANPPAAKRFEAIKQKTRAVIGELDAIVWSIDPNRDTLPSLASYLASFFEEYTASFDLECSVEITRNLPVVTLGPDLRHNLYLAVKEATHNAVKHAAARRFELRIETRANQLLVTVKDNGRGHDFASLHCGQGLTNLQDRLAAIGGHCEIHSRIGQGTTVLLCVPFC